MLFQETFFLNDRLILQAYLFRRQPVKCACSSSLFYKSAHQAYSNSWPPLNDAPPPTRPSGHARQDHVTRVQGSSAGMSSLLCRCFSGFILFSWLFSPAAFIHRRVRGQILRSGTQGSWFPSFPSLLTIGRKFFISHLACTAAARPPTSYKCNLPKQKSPKLTYLMKMQIH